MNYPKLKDVVGSRKMRNVPTWVGDKRFASKKEAGRYRELLLQEKAGLIRNLKVHPIYRLEINGFLIARYIADFDYYDIAKEQIVIEDVKGRRQGVQYDLFRLKARTLYAICGLKVTEI